MVEFMGQMRKFRIQQERKQQISERQSLVATIYSDWQREKGCYECPMPTAADFFGMPQIRDIVELPADVTITVENFQPICKRLSRIIDHWRCCTIYDLRSDLLWRLEIHPPYSQDPRFIECEKLAVAVFTCKAWLCEDIPEPNHSPRYMYFPEYLHHRCNRIRRQSWDELDPPNTIAMGQGYPGSTVQREWSTDDLEFDKKASQTVKNIIHACDLDWRVATVSELDDLDPRLVCLKCSYGNRCDGERPMIARSWRESVS
jgi:hypothetical protein